MKRADKAGTVSLGKELGSHVGANAKNHRRKSPVLALPLTFLSVEEVRPSFFLWCRLLPRLVFEYPLDPARVLPIFERGLSLVLCDRTVAPVEPHQQYYHCRKHCPHNEVAETSKSPLAP